MREHVFVHTMDRNPDGAWWVTTRRDGEPWSGMPLDYFLNYRAADYGMGDSAMLTAVADHDGGRVGCNHAGGICSAPTPPEVSPAEAGQSE